jgi:Flp pilus assembly pilin Flp
MKEVSMHRSATTRCKVRPCDQDGQATAEYALLTGAVAVILALVTAWATSTGKVSALLDAVFDNLIGSV